LDVQGNINFLEGLLTAQQFVPGGPQPQPFRLPNSHIYMDRIDARSLPETCSGRLVGNATIAGHGFRNPQSIVAHLVLFGPDKFIVMWLGGLNTASMFVKVSKTDRFSTFL
jgi:hypothetical protein